MTRIGNDNDYYNLMELIARLKHALWGVDEDTALTNMLNDNTYNHRAWYDDNPTNAAKMAQGNPAAHWPDAYKTAMHPTFSVESKYSGKKSEYNPAGITGDSWGYLDGLDIYTPTRGQLRYWSPADLYDYFKRVEPSVKLMPHSNKYNDGKNPEKMIYNYLPAYTGGKTGWVRPKQESFSAWARHLGPAVLKEMHRRGIDSYAVYDSVMRQAGYETQYSGTLNAPHNYTNIKAVGKQARHGAYRDFASDDDWARAYFDNIQSRWPNALKAKTMRDYVRAIHPDNGLKYSQTPWAKYYHNMAGVVSGSKAATPYWNDRKKLWKAWSEAPLIVLPVDATRVVLPYVQELQPLHLPTPVAQPEALPTTYLDPSIFTEQPEEVLLPLVEDNLYAQSVLPDISGVMRSFLLSNGVYAPDETGFVSGLDLPGAKEGKNPGIHINPANRGKFNATKKRTGKTTEELAHSKNPLTRKRAIFSMNARKWRR